MKRLLPKTFAGQFIALLLIALSVSQAVSFWFFFDERRMAVRTAAQRYVFSRTASVVRLLADTPPRLHAQVLDATSSRRLRFWISDTAAAGDGSDDEREEGFAQRLRAELPDYITTAIVNVEDEEGFLRGPFRVWRWRERHDHDDQVHRPSPPWPTSGQPRPGAPGDGPRLRHRIATTISVQLPDQRWLNAATTLRTPPLIWAVPSFTALAVTALALVIVVVVMVRRIVRPMQRLASAADRLGRGEAVAPLPAEGPDEVRRTTRAFDRMRERLQRFVNDRTRMLAAISHDLRTPLTTLRLRAEFIDDPEVQEKMLATIEEMGAMVEATLAFAREEAAREDTRTVDLAAMTDSVCADFADTGHDVTCAAEGRMPIACRPVGLRRAIRNVVENAVRYGTRARVTVEKSDAGYRITVDDDGPGIPEDDQDRVFEPFLRLEQSRGKEGGGIGLGLSIVRSIVHAHGGTVTLKNRDSGGLRVTLMLPLE